MKRKRPTGIEFRLVKDGNHDIEALDWNRRVDSESGGDLMPGWVLEIDEQYRQTRFSFAKRTFLRSKGRRTVEMSFVRAHWGRLCAVRGRVVGGVVEMEKDPANPCKLSLVDAIMMDRMLAKLGLISL